MSDDEFLAAFNALTLPPAQFNHRAHMRLAWIALQRHPFEDAVERTCEGIRAYATHLGAAGKFNWTVTQALMQLMRDAGAADRALAWEAFEERARGLLGGARERLSLHYSDEALEAGRHAFAQPDRLPRPA